MLTPKVRPRSLTGKKLLEIMHNGDVPVTVSEIRELWPWKEFPDMNTQEQSTFISNQLRCWERSGCVEADRKEKPIKWYLVYT